ncbi:MAG: hypothetical protein HQL13_03370, partial [Candidatus Omnitrophica bacterium]|nr:hypothetical protein [Candidatus Omnitrophota bacterium]
MKKDNFFSSLPEYAKAFAIPIEYRDKGIYRKGRLGPVHEWGVKKISEKRQKRFEKTVSVVLDNYSNVVAIKNGKPISLTDGFSDTDGILSKTACGGIDTSIVFQMFSGGKSAQEIKKILSEKSGFKSLLGKDLDIKDILARRDAKARFAREIYLYQL